MRAAAGGTAAELAAFPTQKHILVVERGHSGFFYGITFLSFIKKQIAYVTDVFLHNLVDSNLENISL